jgi:hypothetical protein
LSLAQPVQANGHKSTAVGSASISLPEVLQVLDTSRKRFENLWCQLQDLADEIEHASTYAGAAADALATRIEANRRRSERNHDPKPDTPVVITTNGHNGNGHRPNTQLVMTGEGLIRECRLCGREVRP